MANLFWPRALSDAAGAPAWIGRALHWLGAAVAAAVLVTAFGFAIDGWAMEIAAWMAGAAVVVAMASRGLRYLLAHE